MRRGDVAAFSISAALTAVVVAALTYSLLVLDRGSSVLVSESANTSWLVVSWGSSLCMVESSNELCTSGDVENMGQTLILHGLWPQPFENQYCGIPQMLAERARKGQGDFPPLDLSDAVRTSLESTMAGSATVAAHEWYAHGTCSGVTPDVYFSDASALTDQVRDALDPVFVDAQGGVVSLNTIRGRLDERFGPGAGERLKLTCRKATGEGSLVVDVRLSLPPVAALRAVDGSMNLGELLLQAPPLDSDCQHGRVP